MNKLFTFFAILLIAQSTQAQIIINEVLYSIPGPGEDQEYVELYNAGSSTVILTGYTLEDANSSSFPDITFDASHSIAAGGYLVVARDSASFHSTFGFAPDGEWMGALNTSGEPIILKDDLGNILDSIYYRPTAPWPAAAVSGGYSVQLCSPTADNADGSNWGTSSNLIGMNGTDNLYGTPGAANVCDVQSYPYYNINQINAVDADGIADSTNVSCEVRGVVHCGDLRGSGGYEFKLLQYDNVGISVFSSSDIGGYVVTEGDSLHLEGIVTQFNGLLQFQPSNITLISQGNALVAPMVVTQVSEATESKHIELQGVYLADPADWIGGPGNTSSFNAYVTTGNTDTILIRVDGDSPIATELAPSGTFNIKGIGGQYDNSFPRTEGYQLQPCSAADIMTGITEVKNQKLSTVKVYPNPSSVTLTVETTENIELLSVSNLLGQEVLRLNNTNTNQIQINVSSLENGIYNLTTIGTLGTQTIQFQVVK